VPADPAGCSMHRCRFFWEFNSVDHLTRKTQVKITIIRQIAKWCDIPITIHKEALREVHEAQIAMYIDECAYLLEKVYDQPAAKISEFRGWAYRFLMENISNPFNLHDHPCDYAGQWLGITYYNHITKTTNTEYATAEERFLTLLKQDEYYVKKFRDGWRVALGFARPEKVGTFTPDYIGESETM
jgi:hypothetical protein